jgi:ankyrin repeat protein
LDSELSIGHGKLAQEIRAGLRDKAAGVFMWVVLVVGILQKEYDSGRRHTLKQKLRETPADLHDLFRSILARDQHERGRLLLCIQWVLLASRPLRPEELYWAMFSWTELEVVSTHDPDDFETSHVETYILSSSKGLAEITASKDPTVQFIHESVRDFLLKEDGLKDLWSGLGNNFRGESHERLKKCCWQYLQVAAVKLKIKSDFNKQRNLFVEKVRHNASKSFPFLEYAVQNVLFHADASDAGGVSQSDFLRTTFHQGFWIEYDNLFERFKARRHSPDASLLYILAERNLPNLIAAHQMKQSCFQSEKERHGSPILAAVVANSQSAIYALLKAEAESAGAASPMHALCEEFRLSKRTGPGLPRGFRKSRTKHPISILADAKEKEVLACALLSTYLNGTFSSHYARGNTLLHYAALSGSEVTTRLLLDNEAQVEGINMEGETPLHYATRHQSEAVARLLLNHGAQTEVANMKGQTPLHYTARYQSEAVARLLLNHGAQIEAADKNGETSLHYATYHQSEAVARLLLDHGAQTEAIDKEGQTPLHYAAYHRSEAISRLLLNHGAQIEATDKEGQTPLHHAVIHRSKAIARLLLDRGAQIEAVDIGGRTVLSYAVAKYISLDIVRLLLNHGAQIEAVDIDGRTVLSHAASGRYGESGIVRVLLGKGARANTADNKGRIPASYAAAATNFPVLEALLEANPSDINSVDLDGQSLLSYAANQYWGDTVETVELLIEGGALVDIADSKGREPLFYAILRFKEARNVGYHVVVDIIARVIRLLIEKSPPMESFGDEQRKLLTEAGLDGAKLVAIIDEFADGYLAQHPYATPDF